MPDTAKLAVVHRTGKPFEIREYPVPEPEPEPGAILIKVALANVCGSDLHCWRGEQDYARLGRSLPLNTGHEHMGTLRPSVRASPPTPPAGRSRWAIAWCTATSSPAADARVRPRRQHTSCPVRRANWLVSCEAWPRTEWVLQKLDHVLHEYGFAKAAIEMALIDLAGKALGVPAYVLLGGLVRDRISLSYSIANQDVARDVEEIRWLRGQGLRVFKIKTGFSLCDTRSSGWKRSERRSTNLVISGASRSW
jgi:hypothetical protein